MLGGWDRLSPNEPFLISHQKAFLCSSQDPLHSLSSVLGHASLIPVSHNPSGFSKVAPGLPGRAAPCHHHPQRVGQRLRCPPRDEWKVHAAIPCLTDQRICKTLERFPSSSSQGPLFCSQHLAPGLIQPVGPPLHSQIVHSFKWCLDIQEPETQTAPASLQVWEPQSQFWVSCTADCAFPPLEWCSRVALQLNTHLTTAWAKHGQLPTSGLPK